LVNKISSFAHISVMQLVASRINSNTTNPGNFRELGLLSAFGRRSLPSSSTAHHLPMDEVATLALSQLEALKSDYYPKTAVQTRPFAPNSTIFEYEAESFFLYITGICGEKFQAYTPIVGGGNNGAVLHYIANNMQLINGDLLLIDAGGEISGYGSDITRTYPLNGRFTENQRLVYNIVLRTQADVVAQVRAGVTWTTLNTVARDSLTRYLLEAGLIQGTIAELTSNTVYSIFYPHGVGHSVGLDVHDSQTNTLEANQIITVEPGVYFNDYLLDQARQGTRSRFVVWSKVDQFVGTGGVRIEDCYQVTATGSIRITTVPSAIAEIEAIMQGAK